ncbi:MAG: response regulator [Chloroflexi bacterium]|nr:response regulator [Chloroflexota bacterium]
MTILRILIVDDDTSLAQTTADIFSISGYEVTVAHSGVEALAALREQSFDCVFSDVKMPEMNGVELYLQMREQRCDVPFVLMSAYAAPELITRGLHAGILAALSKPLDMRQVLSFLNALGVETGIAIIDDDADFCRSLHDILVQQGYSVTTYTDPAQALAHFDGVAHVVLLDLVLNHISGLDIFRQIRAHYPSLPVIFISAHRHTLQQVLDSAPEFASIMYLTKPLALDDLHNLLRTLRQRQLQSKLQP